MKNPADESRRVNPNGRPVEWSIYQAKLDRRMGDVRAGIAWQNCSNPLPGASGPFRRFLYPSFLLGLVKHSAAK